MNSGLRGCLLAAMLVLALPCSLAAQGMYLSRGQSGFGASVSYQGNSEVTGYGVSAGYSFSGLWDMGLTASRSVVSSGLAGGGVNGVAVGPSLAFHAKEGAAISVELQGTYQHGFYSSEAVAGSHVGLKKDYAVVGTSVYGRIPLAGAVSIVPSASAAYSTGSVNLSDGFENRLLSSDVNPFIITLAAGLLYPAGSSYILQLSPALLINENTTSVQLSLGVILPAGE